MQISIANLEKAQRLAAQRVFLQDELKEATAPGTLLFANAKVVIEPRTGPKLTVEIEEKKQGAISHAIREFIIGNITDRIKLLDRELADLGIEVTV